MTLCHKIILIIEKIHKISLKGMQQNRYVINVDLYHTAFNMPIEKRKLIK